MRYPLVLDVHGGPGVAFRNSFDALHFEGAHQVPPELYLSRGYLVLMANPRGDPGYGREHKEAILEGWEYPPRYDLIEGVREMVGRGYAEPEDRKRRGKGKRDRRLGPGGRGSVKKKT